MNSRITINISGEIYETYKKTLLRYPDTVLGMLNEMHPRYCPTSGQYFFPRHRRCFEAILFFYQSHGVLRCPPDIPLDIFEEECIYFRLPSESVHSIRLKKGLVKDQMVSCEDEITFQHHMHTIVSNPHSSCSAMVYGSIVLACNIVSIGCTCSYTVSKNEQSLTQDINFAMSIILLLDLLLRFFFATNVMSIMLSPPTLIDISSGIAFFIFYAYPPTSLSVQMKTLTFVCMLRVLNISRIMGFSKHYQTTSKIILQIFKETNIFFLGILMVVVLYGGVMSTVERNGPLHDMEQACWWAMQTLTTLGYGDVYPTTALGKLIAGLFMSFGTQIILLPVMTIANKFEAMYELNFGL